MLYNIVLIFTVQQNETDIHTSPLFLHFLPIYVTTQHRVKFSVLYNRFSLFIYPIHSINSIDNVNLNLPIPLTPHHGYLFIQIKT